MFDRNQYYFIFSELHQVNGLYLINGTPYHYSSCNIFNPHAATWCHIWKASTALCWCFCNLEDMCTTLKASREERGWWVGCGGGEAHWICCCSLSRPLGFHSPYINRTSFSVFGLSPRHASTIPQNSIQRSRSIEKHAHARSWVWVEICYQRVKYWIWKEEAIVTICLFVLARQHSSWSGPPHSRGF